ncbi:MAG: branched-chain amino acid ABC transporter permease, partial [Monoglobaceae bacterium]
MTFISNLINGISLGSVYAIIALGYTMVYGIAKMLNFAHGDVIMVGAYISYCVTAYLGLPPIVSILAAMIVCTILGMTIERFAYKPLRKAGSLAVLITAIGVSYLLQNVALLIWGSNPKSFASVVSFSSISLFNGGLIITAESIVTVIACIVIMIGLTMFT